MSLKTSAIRYMDELFQRYPALLEIRTPLISAVEEICKCHLSGGKVLICGNGGSAADSDHIVGELMKGFVLPRKLTSSESESLRNSGAEDWQTLASQLQRGIPAIALTQHPALSSAVLNDNDPLMAFSQQTFVLGRAGDLLIGISTSGNAQNVINAMKVARAFGLITIGMTGTRPSRMDEFCKVLIKVPETETFKIQELHLPVYHTLCLMVEEQVFGE